MCHDIISRTNDDDNYEVDKGGSGADKERTRITNGRKVCVCYRILITRILCRKFY